MKPEKVAIVSGIGGPVGSALSEVLSEAGVSVELVGQQSGGTPAPIMTVGSTTVDFTHEDQIQKAVQSILEKRQRIDYLVTCPDLRYHHPLWELPEKLWDESVAINLTSVFLMCKHVVPVMMKQKSGKIVNVISDAARIGTYQGAAYASTKAAVIGFSKALSREVASYGITVNLVSAGYVGEGTLPFRQEPDGNTIPLGRVGQWQEVANACLFLLDEKAGYMTGQTVHVNGGLLMP